MGTTSMASLRQLECMSCNDSRETEHQVFISSCKSTTALIHSSWCPMLRSCSLQGNIFIRIFKHGGCALPLAYLHLFPLCVLPVLCVFPVWSQALLPVSSLSPFSSFTLTLSSLHPLSFLCTWEKWEIHVPYKFSGFGEEKFSLDACVITSPLLE